MPSGQRGPASRGFTYWLSLLIGCLAAVVIGGLMYFHFQPRAFPHVVPSPTYSKGPGGLYDPGVTLIPNPPTTPTP